jgi:hypothetical protein
MGCLLCYAPAVAIKMIDDGCTNIVQAYGDLPAADLFSALFANGYKSKGLDPAGLKVVKIPLVPGDYSAQAAQIGDADCLYGSVTYLQWPSLITALNGVGASPRLYGLQGNLNSGVVEQFPEETEGAVVVNTYPNFEGDQWSDYQEALETYDAGDLEWNSLAGLGTWAAYTAFTQIAESIDGEITNASFLEAANKADAVDTNGMVGDIDFTEEWTGLGGQFPRTFNFTVFFDEVKDGELVPIDGESIDVTNPLEGNPD